MPVRCRFSSSTAFSDYGISIPVQQCDERPGLGEMYRWPSWGLMDRDDVDGRRNNAGRVRHAVSSLRIACRPPVQQPTAASANPTPTAASVVCRPSVDQLLRFCPLQPLQLKTGGGRAESKNLDHISRLWTVTCMTAEITRFLLELPGCVGQREVTDCPCVASRSARCS
jgi:hypothetical protein